jgi:hypothetical protein
MSDSDMDKVTAGDGASVSGTGPGVTVTLPAEDFFGGLALTTRRLARTVGW